MSEAAEMPPEEKTPVGIRRRADRVTLAVVVGVVAALGGFAAFVLSTAKARAEEVSGPTVLRVDALAGDLERHKAEASQAHQQLRADMREVQLDVRALYRSGQSGERSQRLERGPTISADGGR